MRPKATHIPAWKEWMLGILFLLGIVGLGYKVEQTDFLGILLYWTPCAIVLVLWLLIKDGFQLRFFLFVGIFARLLLIFSFPNLSDDIYRFYWDGILWTQGINPLAHPPSFYMQEGQLIPGLTAELYANLNSPDYFTIYPPVLQALFGSAAFMSSSVVSFAVLLKLVLFLFEMGTIWFLFKILGLLNLDKNRAIWYVLNPLVILEVIGNLHFEGAMVFFLALGLFYLFTNRNLAGAAGFAGSIGSKLLPLMFLPATIRYLGWKKGFVWAIITVAFFLVLCLPFFDSNLIQNFLDSFDLYFRKFEFNASLYYIVREVGYWFTGYNQIAYIGPSLGVISLLVILYLAFLKKWNGSKSYISMLLTSFLIYLLLSATVHPWYLVVPVFLSVFTNFRFVVVWSLTAMLSYSHYKYGVFQENYWLIALEYLIPLYILIGDHLKKPTYQIKHHTN
ncbi:MAG: hypothetical protein KDC24_14515 [Saprospiraceae bacterium]|nr:hypothetical protein [Saprospiraceae bacterium]